MELFGPNSHSNHSITYRQIKEIEQFALAELVLRHYSHIYNIVIRGGIAQVCEAEEASNNFRIPVRRRLRGEEIFILLRKYKREDTSGVQFLTDTLRFLRTRRVLVPVVIRTSKNTVSVLHDGACWQAFYFLKGDHFRGTEEELVGLANGLANLHAALKKLPMSRELLKRAAIRPSWMMADLRAAVDLAKQYNETALDQLLLNSVDFLLEEGAHIQEQLKKVVEPRTQVIHGDLHPHNTLFVDEKLRAFLDFEMMRPSELLRDVGFAAHRAARQCAVYVSGNAAQRQANAQSAYAIFVDQYAKRNPLTDAERSQLQFFNRSELMRRIIRDFMFTKIHKGGTALFASTEELRKKITLLHEAKILSL